MTNFVILEGCDGGGKSTLAQELEDEFDVKVVHVGPPRDDMTVLGEHLRLADEAINNGSTVFDRFHLGTYAYGKEFREYHNFDGIGDFFRADWEWFEEHVRNSCVLILCDPGWQTVHKEWERRQTGYDRGPYAEYEADVNRLARVHHNFIEAFDYSTLRKRVYDWTKEKAWQDLRDFLWQELEWREVSIR